jgi:hypothetical protein
VNIFLSFLLTANLNAVVYASRSDVTVTLESDCLISTCAAKQHMAGYAEIDISPEIGVDMVPTMTA